MGKCKYISFLLFILVTLVSCDGSREQRQIDTINERLDSLEEKTKPIIDTLDKKLEKVGEKATDVVEKIDSTVKKKIDR